MTDQENDSSAILPSDALVQSVISGLENRVSEFDKDFCKRMYADDFPKYQRRLEALDLFNAGQVLDAGCGFGQWTLSLATMGNTVSACDISDGRVEFVNEITRHTGLPVDCRQSTLPDLPFDDDSFDVVFCYGVIFLTPWKETLASLARVLKPGGRLYVNANGLGWFVFLWKTEHNKFGEYDPKREAADSFANTLAYERTGHAVPGRQIVIEPDQMQAELENLEFSDFLVGGEGTLKLDPNAPEPMPFFSGEYDGLTGVYEIMCRLKS